MNNLYDFFEELLNCQDFQISDMQIDENMKIVLIKLQNKRKHLCPVCGSEECSVNSIHERTVKHLRIFEYETIIELPQYQLKCKKHGLVYEKNSFVEKGTSFSKLFKHHIYEINKIMPIKYTAEYFGVSQDTIRRIDKQMIKIYMNMRDLNPSVIGLDEMSIGAGHRNYIHILSDPEEKEVIAIGNGRKGSDVNLTLEKHKEKLKNVKYAVIDMWDAFENSIKKYIPDVKIIFDKFHIVKKLQEAIDEIRKFIFSNAQGKSKEVVKGKKYILLSRQKNLTEKGKKNLKKLMKLNKPLFKAYLMKENFFHFWDYKKKKWAQKFFQKWKLLIKRTKLLQLIKFAEMIERRSDGVFNYFDVKGNISLGYVEGINNKARHLINRGYGFRNKEYLFLKIIQQCSKSLCKFDRYNLKKYDFEFT